jgi:hypothetical protein
MVSIESIPYSKDPRVMRHFPVLRIIVSLVNSSQVHIKTKWVGLSLISVVQPLPGEGYEEKYPRLGDRRGGRRRRAEKRRAEK